MGAVSSLPIIRLESREKWQLRLPAACGLLAPARRALFVFGQASDEKWSPRFLASRSALPPRGVFHQGGPAMKKAANR